MTNPTNTVLYTGVTSNLPKRVYEHKAKLFGGFTHRYNCTKLVYYECYDNIVDAIGREKQIKSGSRQKKIDLIQGLNAIWQDLAEKL